MCAMPFQLCLSSLCQIAILISSLLNKISLLTMTETICTPSCTIHRWRLVSKIIRSHNSTTYVDTAYCNKPCSVVCLSVCLSVTVVSPAKTAELIEMPLGLRIREGPKKHVLGEVHTGATWRIQLNRPCAVAMRPCCLITLTTCFLAYKMRKTGGFVM